MESCSNQAKVHRASCLSASDSSPPRRWSMKLAIGLVSFFLAITAAAQTQNISNSSSDVIPERATVFLTTAEVSNLRQEAEKGDANAEYSLGILYMEGLGLLRDDTEGVKWHKAAAAQGQADAQFMLGYLYENGKKIARDSG